MKTFVRSTITHEVEIDEEVYTISQYSDEYTDNQTTITDYQGYTVDENSDLGCKIMTEFRSN